MNKRTGFGLRTRKAIADMVVSAKLPFRAFSGSRSDEIINSGGYSLRSREDDIDTVDSARLPCFPPTVPKAHHHISLLCSEFIERDNACEHGDEKRPRKRPSNFDMQPDQVAGGRYVAHRKSCTEAGLRRRVGSRSKIVDPL